MAKDPVGGPSAREVAEARAAAELLKEFLARHFILDDCRQKPVPGCPSCQAINVGETLDRLLSVF